MTELLPWQIQKRQELTQKLKNGTLTKLEAEELRQLLQLEQNRANILGDVLGGLAVVFLLALVIDYLTKK